ncbi:hypothetical protein KL905_001353 [Ogataea polymorpha]|uniref:Uncharacterized protein n=1 Tax=Ogataea polymorpha TaxID=460523 RepID=A0A9P8PE93_9ASCO|nr:hypothetical protein KL937_002744 [Ogataea polymorpha]KAG7896946.1 hypothetical protein KL908_000348 [Ogataea polymorpha]KAG7903249.1 hypothetical protein KL935_000781 [Ogataea polymorpha]KAG7912145.1 hypothetical protein KL906_000349 [Ogataea polymorpha]KAG7913283.1 hypothetical protein KL907_000228 [Ogataea polymorpha]
MAVNESSTLISLFCSKVRTRAITCFTNFKPFKNSADGFSLTAFNNDSSTEADAFSASRSARYVSKNSCATIPKRTLGSDFLNGISVVSFLQDLLSRWNLSKSSWFSNSKAMMFEIRRSFVYDFSLSITDLNWSKGLWTL